MRNILIGFAIGLLALAWLPPASASPVASVAAAASSCTDSGQGLGATASCGVYRSCSNPDMSECVVTVTAVAAGVGIITCTAAGQQLYGVGGCVSATSIYVFYPGSTVYCSAGGLLGLDLSVTLTCTVS